MGSSPHTRGAPRENGARAAYLGIIPAYAGSTGPGVFDPPRGRDHPRIRGEHVGGQIVLLAVVGSSPHTRGALHDRVGGPPWPGIIPAYAGSTGRARRDSRGEQDHPRIRGEHTSPRQTDAKKLGSSPHTRGAPATTRGPILSPGDHPRIRGEHCQAILPVSSLAGSSPHTRGARRHRRALPRPRGIIPAYAGSTVRARRRPSGRWDHPRIRGEHAGARAYTPSRPGSSPHTRGARTEPPQNIVDRGIIPAYAGSTFRSYWLWSRPRYHPRIRGEHFPEPGLDVGQAGSSPHTRGALCSLSTPSTRRGIIPAYAGSTVEVPAASFPAEDHPRIRGEHSPAVRSQGLFIGSSPHTRGARKI